MDPDRARFCGGTDPGPNMIQFAKVVGRRRMHVPLIHMSLASFQWDICKQYRLRSDTTEGGIDQGVYCLLSYCSTKI